MSNELTETKSNQLGEMTGENTINLLRKGVSNTRQVLPPRQSFGYMGFGKDGIWTHGREHIEVEPGSLWAINPVMTKYGYVCWTVVPEGSKEPREKLGQVLAMAYEDPIDPNTLPDYGHPWKPAASLQFKCLSGEDEGTELIFETNSVGGTDLAAHVMDLVGERMASTDDDKLVPVGTLGSTSYIHKQHSKIYKPTFDVKKWVSLNDPTPPTVDESPFVEDKPQAQVAAEPDGQPDEQPVQRTRTRRRRS